MHRRNWLTAATGAVVAVFSHRALPGYRVLGPADRLRIDLLAAGRVLRSRVALRMLVALSIWLLFAYPLVWRLDWHGVAAHAPFPAALLWWLPWLAAARRRELRALLGPAWRI